jgi:hypothetical protein
MTPIQTTVSFDMRALHGERLEVIKRADVQQD